MKTLSLVAIIFVLGIGQANAQASGEITPNGVTFPRYTDANRPAGLLTIGTTIFNTSQNTHQYWNGSGWVNINAAPTGSILPSTIVLSDQYPNSTLESNGYTAIGTENIVLRPNSTTPRRWSVIAAPTARYGHTGIAAGNKMIVWGGVVDISPYYANNGYIYDTEKNTWNAMATPTFLGGRYQHSDVWTGTKLIVWGGYGNPTGNVADYQFYGNGGIYDITTGAWTAISSTGAPSARSGHSAIWTGTRMIVWGGATPNSSGGFTNLSDGYSFDPATNTWTTIATSGLSGRSNHSAVWTGTQMIIWGGSQAAHASASICYNDGKMYNPTTNSWSSVTSASSPTARAYHSCVWTGSKMIVWGGANTNTDPVTSLNTGAIFDPSTNSWTIMATGLSARFGHTATWDGTKMRVFGGNQSSGNRYGIFYPDSNTWESFISGPPLSPIYTYPIVGEPSNRTSHSAIWNGIQYIVWGGNLSTNTLTSTGGVLSDFKLTTEDKTIYLYKKQ